MAGTFTAWLLISLAVLVDGLCLLRGGSDWLSWLSDSIVKLATAGVEKMSLISIGVSSWLRRQIAHDSSTLIQSTGKD